ncbi:MAG TPA: hypothetical protein VK776_20450 [Bryobacteraceae bacterium]|nr:hypothetical protein [Bryobacteraceae bacterium]
MIRARMALGILCGVLGASMLGAGDFSSYRGFQFGMDLSAAAKQAGMNASEAVVLHQHPALIQQLDWRPRWPVQAKQTQADPVEDGLLCFYNGELFRIVVTYDRYRMEGMTADDVIDAISQTYGAATRPTAEVEYHSTYGEAAQVIARWENEEYSYNLVQTGNGSSFAMILYSKRADALAQAANVEAVRLEAQEAPQREIDKQKKHDDDDRLALEKARSANKPNFRP